MGQLLKETLDQMINEIGGGTSDHVDPQQLRMLFASLDKLYDDVIRLTDRLDPKTKGGGGQLGRRMQALGYGHEAEQLAKKLDEVVELFGDFMPGLQMQVDGGQ